MSTMLICYAGSQAPAWEPGRRSSGFAGWEAEFPEPSASRFLIAIGLSIAAGVAGAEEPEATPYRPTVSNPAALPVPGMPEIELGGLHTSGGSEQQRDGVPFLAKYAFNAIGASWPEPTFTIAPFRWTA